MSSRLICRSWVQIPLRAKVLKALVWRLHVRFPCSYVKNGLYLTEISPGKNFVWLKFRQLPKISSKFRRKNSKFRHFPFKYLSILSVETNKQTQGHGKFISLRFIARVHVLQKSNTAIRGLRGLRKPQIYSTYYKPQYNIQVNVYLMCWGIFTVI